MGLRELAEPECHELLASRVVGKPCATSQVCNESLPRCLCTTITASPSSVSAPNQRRSIACSAALPMRIAGLLHSVAKLMSAGTSSGAQTRTLRSPLRAAFDAHSARARSFTSTAHTVASGARDASVSAIAP